MKALLIAGGFGTRLRPLTLTRPKHLLPIANRPHLYHVFDHLQRHEIDEVVLLTSYLAETFDVAVDEARGRGLTVHVRHEDVPLGTAGALKNAADVLDDETFFAFNGDVLSAIDLTAALRFHRERSAEATIVLTPVDDPSAYGVVPTEPDGRVLGFIEKPPRESAPTNLINAGVYLMQPSVLDRIPEGQEWSAERALFPQLVDEDAALFATPTDAYWMDIGTPQKYLAANLDALRGTFVTDAVTGDGSNCVGNGAVVDGAVAESAIGAGCHIAAGATIERSVLLPGVVVAEGAVVRDSVLGEDVQVGAGAHLRDAAIGDREKV